MSTQLKGDIQINADPTRFVQGITRAEQSLSKLQQGTTKTGQSLRTLDQSTTKSSQSTQRLTQSTTQASQAMQRMGQSTQQAAAGAQRLTQSTQQATQATSRFNAGTIATGASIATMGAGVVSMEASFSNYTKAAQKVEKAEQGVQKTRDLLLTTNVSLQRAELKLSKMQAKGTASAAELAAAHANVELYTQKRATATRELAVKEQDLNIAMMDQADTHKLMASSIATTVIGTISMAAQMIQAKAATAGATTSMVANMKANLANSKALKFLGIDLNAARANFANAGTALKGYTVNATGARVAVTGFSKATQVASMTIKGLWASLGPIGILTILATSLYTAWETSQQFRDGVMWLIDGIQDLLAIVKQVIVPLQWLDEGLKAIGINVGESVDEWQEHNAVIGQAETQLYDADAAVKQLDTDVEDLTVAVDTDTAAMQDMSAATTDLTAMTTIATTAIQAKSAAISADMHALRDNANVMRSEGMTALQDFRASIDSASEGAKNYEQTLADNKLMVRTWANEYIRIMADEGPQAAAVFAADSKSSLDGALANIQKYGGDTGAVLAEHNVNWQAVGISVSDAATSVSASTGQMASDVTRNMGAATASTLQLMHMMDSLSKKKSSVLNELKNIQHVSQMTAAQIARVKAEYNNMKTNEMLLERGLPPQGKFYADDKIGSVYVMGSNESALKADGTIDYDLLQRIGNVSARNLAKIKQQSKAFYGAQAATYLQQLGLATVNYSADDKQDVRTVREMAQTNNYANPDHGKNPNPQAGASDKKRGLIHRNQRDAARVKSNAEKSKRVDGMLTWLGTHGTAVPSSSRSPGRAMALVDSALAKTTTVYNTKRKIITDAGLNPESIGRTPISKIYKRRYGVLSYVKYPTWLQGAHDQAAKVNELVDKASKMLLGEYGITQSHVQSLQSDILSGLGTWRGPGYNYKLYEKRAKKQVDEINARHGTTFTVDDLFSSYRRTASSGGGSSGFSGRSSIDVIQLTSVLVEKAIKDKRDRELAEQLRQLEMKEAAERKAQAEQEAQQRRQDIYESQMKSYNEDMALYNMIIRMFPGQTPDYKPTMPTLQTSSSSHASPQQARDLLTPISYHTQYMQTREDLGAGGEGGTIAHNTAVSYIRELMAGGRKDDAIKIMNNILKDEYLDSEHTTPDMITQVANLYAQYDPTGAKNMLSTIHDHESQRHADDLARAGLWKSEYEGHDVYELRQIVELHAI